MSNEQITNHMIEETITKEQAFQIFRENFTSINVNAWDDYIIYGPFHKKFAATSLETAKALIKRKNLPLKARIEDFVVTCTLIIEET